MKVYKREINGLQVEVWNDSNVDWVIQDKERTSTYSIKSFTMKHAVQFHCEMYTQEVK